MSSIYNVILFWDLIQLVDLSMLAPRVVTARVHVILSISFTSHIEPRLLECQADMLTTTLS